MLTRYYVRQMKYNTQVIGCYDLEHGTGRHDAYNALLKVTNDEATVVIEVLDSITLSEEEGETDKAFIHPFLRGAT